MTRLSTQVIKSGLIVGTLDILSAFIYYKIKTGDNHVFNVLTYISSAIVGKKATAGIGIMFLGLFLHYFIAMSFTVFFFWVYPKITAASKQLILTGIVYGLFIWSIMNLIVVPLSNIGRRPFNTLNAVINATILIICIGIPLAIMAGRYFRRNYEKP